MADEVVHASIAVVFSSFNGAGTLPEMLSAYRTLRTPPCDWHMVAVDNASTDDTAAILAEAARDLPITVLSEPRPGKNVALNAALDRVRAGLTIFTDDDAAPDPGFLQAWARHRKSGAFDLFGGVVRPRFPAGTAPALLKEVRHHPELYACNDRRSGVIEADEIFGPNMAVSRRVLDTGLRFNEDIGPNSTAGNYPMGSETEFCERAARVGGYRSWFEDAAVVAHLVRPEQTTPDFFERRAYRHGRGYMARLMLNGADAPPRWISPVQRAKHRLRALARGPFSHDRWQVSWMKGVLDVAAADRPPVTTASSG